MDGGKGSYGVSSSAVIAVIAGLLVIVAMGIATG